VLIIFYVIDKQLDDTCYLYLTLSSDSCNIYRHESVLLETPNARWIFHVPHSHPSLLFLMLLWSAISHRQV